MLYLLKYLLLGVLCQSLSLMLMTILLKPARSPALHRISITVMLVADVRLSMNWIRCPLRTRFPSFLPSMASPSSPFFLSMSPIKFNCRFLMIVNKLLVVPAMFRTLSLDILFIQDIFIVHLKNCLSAASSFSLALSLIVQHSLP